MRLHPAIVAQAAATTAALMPGRFFLVVGTGENLNEHIVGRGWPETEVRQERLEEAIEVIHQLWRGGNQSHHGRHFTVENARLYSLPDALPPPPGRRGWTSERGTRGTAGRRHDRHGTGARTLHDVRQGWR